jgi:hypothetical protein
VPAAAGGEDEDRRGDAAVAPAAEERQPVHPGQAEVENHRCVVLRGAEEIRAHAVARAVDRIAGRAERLSQLPRQSRLVFHHQNPHGTFITQLQLNDA